MVPFGGVGGVCTVVDRWLCAYGCGGVRMVVIVCVRWWAAVVVVCVRLRLW